jgi:hypothetical protein
MAMPLKVSAASKKWVSIDASAHSKGAVYQTTHRRGCMLGGVNDVFIYLILSVSYVIIVSDRL